MYWTWVFMKYKYTNMKKIEQKEPNYSFDICNIVKRCDVCFFGWRWGRRSLSIFGGFGSCITFTDGILVNVSFNIFCWWVISLHKLFGMYRRKQKYFLHLTEDYWHQFKTHFLCFLWKQDQNSTRCNIKSVLQCAC